MMSGFSLFPIGFSATIPTSPDFVFSLPPFALPRLHLLCFVRCRACTQPFTMGGSVDPKNGQ